MAGMLYLSVYALIILAVIFVGIIYIAIMSAIVRTFGLFGYMFVISLHTLGPVLLIFGLAL